MSSLRFASIPTLLKSRKMKVVPMVGDGNCFYRAVATAFYKDVEFHPLLRKTLMEHMLEDAGEYVRFFESAKKLERVLIANKRLGVWNSDLADLAPLAMSKLLDATLEIFAVTEDDEVICYTFGEGYNKIRLLLEDNHYDVLVKK